MTRPLPRAPLFGSPLVRFLTENALLEPARVSKDIGSRLGDWLNFRQAIALHGLFNAQPPSLPANPSELTELTGPNASPAHLRRATRVSGKTLGHWVDKVRAQLTQSVLQGAPPGSGLARIDLPPAELDATPEPKTAFEPNRRYYAAHQRQMATAIQTLRAQVCTQLRLSTPALQQLAALDASFESILSEREAALLGQVVKRHEKRFGQALKAHMKQPDSPPNPAAWLLPFHQHLRSALLAELDTRLQPTLGMLEALQHATPPDSETPP